MKRLHKVSRLSLSVFFCIASLWHHLSKTAAISMWPGILSSALAWAS